MKASLIRLGCAALLAAAGIAQATPIQWSDNGHYYEYVSTPTNWDDAVTAAASSTYLGMTGYLATVTSQQEMEFIQSAFSDTSNVWLGGSDAGEEGVWKWMTGPETGQTFYELNAAVQPGYSNWGWGEPNNYGIENYLHYFQAGGGNMAWNDLTNLPLGYLVEYSSNNAVPEPGSLALIGAAGVAGAVTRRRKRG